MAPVEQVDSHGEDAEHDQVDAADRQDRAPQQLERAGGVDPGEGQHQQRASDRERHQQAHRAGQARGPPGERRHPGARQRAGGEPTQRRVGPGEQADRDPQQGDVHDGEPDGDDVQPDDEHSGDRQRDGGDQQTRGAALDGGQREEVDETVHVRSPAAGRRPSRRPGHTTGPWPGRG